MTTLLRKMSRPPRHPPRRRPTIRPPAAVDIPQISIIKWVGRLHLRTAVTSFKIWLGFRRVIFKTRRLLPRTRRLLPRTRRLLPLTPARRAEEAGMCRRSREAGMRSRSGRRRHPTAASTRTCRQLRTRTTATTRAMLLQPARRRREPERLAMMLLPSRAGTAGWSAFWKSASWCGRYGKGGIKDLILSRFI